jgi:hypothetical protein
MESFSSITAPDHTLQEPHMRSFNTFSGKFFHIPPTVQSFPPVTIMCSGQWKIHRKIIASLWMQMYRKQSHHGFTIHRTAADVVEWTHETVGCLSQQLWGICQITWLSCCTVCRVCLYNKKPLHVGEQPVKNQLLKTHQM